MTRDARDIHRGSEVTRLTQLLDQPPDGLSIVAISGAGGVGKTFLVNHVLETTLPENHGYMLLRADASNALARTDFFALIEGQLFRRSLPRPADPRKDYFPRLREIAALHRTLVDDATVEMEADAHEPEPKVRAVAKAMLNAGRFLNTTFPITGLYVDASAVDDSDVEALVKSATSLLTGLKTFRESTRLPGPLRDLFGISRRNRVRRDLFALTAEEIRADLTAALVGWDRRDAARLTHGRISGVDKVVMVLDDYEVTSAILADFLVGSLVPQLAAAPFRSVLLIVGRDDLEVTHPGWSQHAAKFLRDQIRLAPFSETDAKDEFARARIPKARWNALYEATQGYPFLVSLVVEEEADFDVASSVVFLRRFYDRTTRWMTEEERDWFVRICYLDKVNEDTLAALFRREEIVRIQDWFEREPSIRDPSAPYFRVRPMIREKMLRYHEIRAPSRHRALRALAASAERERSRLTLA